MNIRYRTQKFTLFTSIATLLVIALTFFADSLSGNAEKPSNPWGINSGFESEGIAQKSQELGVSWARMTIYWDQVEPAKGQLDFRGPDSVIERAIRRRFNLYIIIHSTPKWANGGKENRVPPQHSKDWEEFVYAVGERYRDIPGVKGYGMWNEPNVNRFWSGGRKEYIQKILIPGAKALRSVNPDILILGPEMSHHWTEQSDWRLWDIMKSGGSSIDIVAMHYYPDSRVPFDDYMERWIKPHRGGKPVWITEIGQTLCNEGATNDEENQRKHYQQFFQVQREKNTWFAKIFPYRIWDSAPGCEDGNGFGLTYGNDMRERPIYRMYQEIVKGSSSR